MFIGDDMKLLFTSYYGFLKNISDYELENYVLVSISRTMPDLGEKYKVYQFKELAPTQSLLNGYKNGTITKGNYMKSYLDYLCKLTPKQWMEKLVGFLKHNGYKGKGWIVFLCYEKYLDDNENVKFCHRHILASYLNTNEEYNCLELDVLPFS